MTYKEAYQKLSRFCSMSDYVVELEGIGEPMDKALDALEEMAEIEEIKPIKVDKMSFVQAVPVIKDINSDRYSMYEKAMAINKMLEAPTINSINKDDLRACIAWLWNLVFKLEDINENDN